MQKLRPRGSNELARITPQGAAEGKALGRKEGREEGAGRLGSGPLVPLKPLKGLDAPNRGAEANVGSVTSGRVTPAGPWGAVKAGWVESRPSALRPAPTSSGLPWPLPWPPHVLHQESHWPLAIPAFCVAVQLTRPLPGRPPLRVQGGKWQVETGRVCRTGSL